MSHTKKKSSLDDIHLTSVTEKLRQNSKKPFQRQCCEKQNDLCVDFRNMRIRDASKSSKKLKKKKYLEEEMEKLIQKRYSNDAIKMSEIKINNSNQIMDLKGDLQEMKDVISKLAHEQWVHKKQENIQNETALQRKIDQLNEELKHQKEVNEKLEDANSQAALITKQQKQFNDKINSQLTELNLKHAECEDKFNYVNNRATKLEEKNRTLTEQNTTLYNENKALGQAQKQLKQTMCQLTQTNKQLQNELQAVKAKQSTLIQLTFKNHELAVQKERLQAQLKKLQSQFNTTKANLGNTELKLKGLISMQKKCQELYQEIKKEHQRWDSINVESIQEKTSLEEEINQLNVEKQLLSSKIQSIEEQMEQLEEQVQNLRDENQIIFNDKVSLSIKIKELEESVTKLKEQKQELTEQKQKLITKRQQYILTLQQKQSFWQNEKNKLQSKLKWLEQQKNDLETEVNGTLETTKQRNAQLQIINLTNCKKIEELESVKSQLNNDLRQYTSQVKILESSIGVKQKKIVDLEQKVNQVQQTLNSVIKRNKQMELKQKLSNEEWTSKLESINHKLDSCLTELRQSKQYTDGLESELTNRQQKIMNLSEIRSEIEQKLNQIEQQLCNSQTARLSLSSDLQFYQSTSRRNEQILQEEKRHYESEVNLKNTAITELKDKLRMVKDESYKIQEQLQQCQKVQELEQIFESQIGYIQNSIKNLTRHKQELELQLSIIKTQNNELNNKIFKLENYSNSWPEKESQYQKTIQGLQKQIQLFKLTCAQKTENISKLQQEMNSQKEISIKELNLLKNQIEQQKTSYTEKMIESQTSIGESTKERQMLQAELENKEKTIISLNERMTMFQDKKRKVINEVHAIQNQISELAIKNNNLEIENKQLEDKLTAKEQILKHFQQKIELLEETNRAFEQKTLALIEQSQLFQEEISQIRKESRQKEEKAQSNINQVMQICEARKSEAINQLKSKINELAQELSSCVNKLNTKNNQLNELEEKYAKLQKVLDENNKLLAEERQTKVKLSLQIDSLKNQLKGKDREVETIIRDKTILREKLSEQQSKCETLRRKFDHLSQQKLHLEREIENQSMTIRILKDENKSIEKVMSDQINQRKVIIEQLVNEKRMLYAQLNHQ